MTVGRGVRQGRLALTSLAVRRPIATSALYLLLLALAGMALMRLPVRLLPDLRFPSLVVWTAYPDVSADQVETGVTVPIEEAVAGASGLVRLTARSQIGGSIVRAEFGWNTPLDLAFFELREQLDRLALELPATAARPLLMRIDPSARPVMVIALTSADTPDPGEPDQPRGSDGVAMKRFASEIVARRLEQLDGVSRVRVVGGRDRRFEVRAKPDLLATYRVGLDLFETSLGDANFAFSGGLIKMGPFRYALEVSGELSSLADIEATTLNRADGQSIRLSDLARVEDTVKEATGLVRIDGSEAVLLLIERRPGANVLRTAAQIRSEIDRLRDDREKLEWVTVVDDSVFIKAALAGVLSAGGLGSVLAVLVLMVFLRRTAPLLAVAAAVPLSMVISLVLFELLGISINIVSLAGLALGMGMLVDNAIVVTESAERRLRQGTDAAQAAIAGASEVASPVTASTLTTIAVFIPLIFAEGLAGRLFRDQSLAVVISLLASLVVSLTAVPALLARASSDAEQRQDGRKPTGGKVGSTWLRRYEQALSFALDHRGAVLCSTLLILAIGAYATSRLPRELIPEGRHRQIDISLGLPGDYDLETLSDEAAKLEASFLGKEGVEHVLTDLGEEAEGRISLRPRPIYRGSLIVSWREPQPIQRIQAELAALDSPPYLDIRPQPVRTELEQLLLPPEADLYVDLSADDPEIARAHLDSVAKALGALPDLQSLSVADGEEVLSVQISLRREALERLGVLPAELALYLEALARGRQVTEIVSTTNSLPVVLRVPSAHSVEALLALEVSTRAGLFPLGSLIEAETRTLPATRLRTDQRSVSRLEIDLLPGVSIVRAEAQIQDVLDRTLPPHVIGRVAGVNEALASGWRSLRTALWLSLALVYLILAAQFESFVQPLVVLITIPLAASGTAVGIFVTGQSLNLMSLIGYVVLTGIVVNDAILKVDRINHHRRRGQGLEESIVQASRERIRPIVMTTLTTVLGMLPLTFGGGAGAELRAPLAICLIGGLIAASSLTLFVVPVLYSLVDRGRPSAGSVVDPVTTPSVAPGEV